MSFTELIFLFGAAAVVGPLLAHLLARPRYRRLPFTMLQFLRAGQMESQSRRRFRDLLMLLLRCAIIVMIAMLFARPRLVHERDADKSKPAYYIGLDNSTSMGYSDARGRYWDQAVKEAVDYIRSADERGVFNIFGLASGSTATGLDKGLALVELKNLKIVAQTAKIGEFLEAAAAEDRRGKGRVSVLIVSDFTPKVLRQWGEVGEPVAVDKVDYRLVASSEPISNVAITGVQVTAVVGGKMVVGATVVNYGAVEQKRKLSVSVGQTRAAEVDVKLVAHQQRVYSVTVDGDVSGLQGVYSLFEEPESGLKQLFLPVELGLSEGDGLREDDQYYIAVSLPQQKAVNVLLAGNGGEETFLLKTALEVLSKTDVYSRVNVRETMVGTIRAADLEWADVVICSTIMDGLGPVVPDMVRFASQGRKVIFFANEKFGSKSAKSLWNSGVLAAMPEKCVREAAYIERQSCGDGGLNIDHSAAKSLTNYRIDKVALKGFLQCQQGPECVCLWRLQNGQGFVFGRRLGNGCALLVNTSIDDSLGSLTKSNACVAFCRYLLGETTRIGVYSFSSEEAISLPASAMELNFAKDNQYWLENSRGRKNPAVVSGSLLTASAWQETGLVKTLNKPTRYAGVNLPEGETDMTAASGEQAAAAVGRVLAGRDSQKNATADVFGDKTYKPIWNMFAWAVIALLLVEPAIANRLKR